MNENANWPKIEPDQDYMPFLIICKFYKDLIKTTNKQQLQTLLASQFQDKFFLHLVGSNKKIQFGQKDSDQDSMLVLIIWMFYKEIKTVRGAIQKFVDKRNEINTNHLIPIILHPSHLNFCFSTRLSI